jgi:flavin reductase (DIM6/NTAB) family NADH-FMN oxidoreductase RutF
VTFYRTGEPHGLSRNPFNQLVVPRPIGWISTLDAAGAVNLAPYSFFNAVAYVPPTVMFAATGPHQHGGEKDSVANIRATGEFVFNLTTWALRDAVNASCVAAPHGVDEFEIAGLTKAPSTIVKPPRVAESPVHLECTLAKIVELPTPDVTDPNTVVFGEVVGVHIDDDVIVDGLVDVLKLDPIARLGYDHYARVTEVFSMTRPDWPSP